MKTCTIISVCESNRTAYQFPKDYQTMAIRLAKSIRKNAGGLKDCDIIFWHGEDKRPDQSVIHKLQSYGCKIVSGKCAVPEDPCSNQFTASTTKVDTDFVLWLDTDIYVNGDLSGLLDTSYDVCMAPDTFGHHTWSSSEWDANWDIFYKHFGVKTPGKIISQIDHKQINFYFNNAVTLFKNNIGFAEMWEKTALELINSGLPNCRLQWYMVASALAVLRGGYSISPLTEHAHYIYANHDHKLEGNPAIIHYQGDRIKEISDQDWAV